MQNGTRLCSSLQWATHLPGSLGCWPQPGRGCWLDSALQGIMTITSIAFLFLCFGDRKCTSDGDFMGVCFSDVNTLNLLQSSLTAQGIFMPLKITWPLLDLICQVFISQFNFHTIFIFLGSRGVPRGRLHICLQIPQSVSQMQINLYSLCQLYAHCCAGYKIIPPKYNKSH